jgi:REP element-mobilizing transposase RayT
MPESLSKVILHIIFSTKNREAWLDSDVRARMHAYLAMICRDVGADIVRVGGTANHVHIVTTLPRTVSQAQMIERVIKRPRNGSKRFTPAIAAFPASGDMVPSR